ncbi:MAG TPA: prepilin-type N-terminal cleavage/methylation domain-containing protein [Candidatus Paceibacterota bacterium]|nr:prepilin-type N-terminal cleavage/methylation domain-containing protein [Candidatus Paceibacterota bacterium]HPT40113.1 prepilin-type N-terminal cleavage/methylation domain-containing protein [Candidatus Paceibacterota bacterium]
MNYKEIKQNSGFTLIESMIAIALIVSGITGLMVLVNRSMGFSTTAFNELAAANLAQEGIELVRNIRDNNWTQQKNWLTGLQDGTYQVDYHDNELIKYSEEGPEQPLLLEQPLLFDEIEGYNYTIGDPTFYYRKIELKAVNSNELIVKSIITWSAKGGKNFETVVEDHLFNWL